MDSEGTGSTSKSRKRKAKIYPGETLRDPRREAIYVAHGRDDSTARNRPAKKVKRAADESSSIDKAGTIERGHIYFFYRPRVQLEEAHSIDDVKNFHILLVPRPPEFAVSDPDVSGDAQKQDPTKAEDTEMKVIQPGADAVPAAADPDTKTAKYRLITVGKKRLPDPKVTAPGRGKSKEKFWAAVTAVGDDLDSLEAGLEAKSYETKTRGTRHEEPVRLAARGGYAIVNTDADIPSQRKTHLGYRVSHPNPQEMGLVQSELGIYSASSFVLQIMNPLARATGPVQARTAKPAQYPDSLTREVFGTGAGKRGEQKGRESYGLRFTSCETTELLDYEGAQLLLIAGRDGEIGLEKSLGEGRGRALSKLGEREGHEPLRKAFDELGLDLDRFPIKSLEGSWI